MKRRPSMFRLIVMLAVSFCAGRAADRPFAGAVRLEQRLGQPVPLDTVFRDTAGGRHALRDYFRGRPVVLYFGYARCPQLCSIVADGTVAALRAIKPAVGRDLEVVSISLDPQETPADAAARRTDAVRRYGETRAPDGWHFLVGDDAAIRAVASSVGFYYVHDARSRQYAHPSGFFVLTPDGVVSRCFPGVDFVATDVAAAVRRAAQGKVGEPVYNLLLLCFRGDGITGRYGTIIWRGLGVAVGLTVAALAGGVGWMIREERRRAIAGDREGTR